MNLFRVVFSWAFVAHLCLLGAAKAGDGPDPSPTPTPIPDCRNNLPHPPRPLDTMSCEELCQYLNTIIQVCPAAFEDIFGLDPSRVGGFTLCRVGDSEPCACVTGCCGNPGADSPVHECREVHEEVHRQRMICPEERPVNWCEERLAYGEQLDCLRSRRSLCQDDGCRASIDAEIARVNEARDEAILLCRDSGLPPPEPVRTPIPTPTPDPPEPKE